MRGLRLDQRLQLTPARARGAGPRPRSGPSAVAGPYAEFDVGVVASLVGPVPCRTRRYRAPPVDGGRPPGARGLTADPEGPSPGRRACRGSVSSALVTRPVGA
ncbi:hypothetical protein ACFPM0_01790 [Pseudonocardia sulfidoxydans]|uniref:hypothetical protein n=1 Tax=Pseudonocardia sulfidoxydans TaxID=54011 RepID=UPI00361FAF27